MNKLDRMTRDELEAELDYWRREHGAEVEAEELNRVKAALGLTKGCARLALALWRAYPRPLARATIHLALCGEETDIKIVDVYASKLRSGLGAGPKTVLAVWGFGYVLSEAGWLMVERVLGDDDAGLAAVSAGQVRA